MQLTKFPEPRVGGRREGRNPRQVVPWKTLPSRVSSHSTSGQSWVYIQTQNGIFWGHIRHLVGRTKLSLRILFQRKVLEKVLDEHLENVSFFQPQEWRTSKFQPKN